jgi:predicted permease
LILVAVAVILAAACGVGCEHRYGGASQFSRRVLALMLYVLIPFVAFINVAHLHVTAGTGVGIVFAWIVVATVGTAAYAAGRLWLRLPNPQLGALICCVVVVNTGYLGLPMAVVLFGTGALGSAVAYDQLVSGPAFFVVAFAVGAAFGDAERSATGLARARDFVLRNPPLIAAVAGLAASPALAPAPLPTISHVVVAIMLVLGFFAVGVNLSAERREDAAPLLERPDRRVALAVVLRMACAPLLLAGLSALFVRVPSAYLLQATMPAGINSLIVGHAYGLDQRLIATVIVWSTAAALVVGLALSL